WEVSMPWYDTQGKIETIVPGEQSTQFPTAPLDWVVPGDPGIPSTLAPTRYNNLGPRIGLAYSPGFTDGVLGKIFGGPGKSSIRAAYGIYYTSIEDLNLFYEVPVLVSESDRREPGTAGRILLSGGRVGPHGRRGARAGRL